MFKEYKMNKILKAISFVSFIFLIPTTSHAEIDSLWSRSYQLDFLHQGWNMHKTVDDGLIILGRVAYNQEGDWITWDHDNAIIKTDQNGDTLWTSRINLWEGHQSFKPSVIEFDNGEFLFTASIMYPNDSEYPVLIRTDSFGDTLWTKHFYSDSTNDLWFQNPINNQGNHYYFSGGTTLGSNELNAWIVEIDVTNGDTLMHKSYGDSTKQYFHNLYKLNDGSFIASGNQTDSNGNRDFWLVKLDESLNVVWEKTYGGGGYDSMARLIINTNGDYTMVGRTESYGQGGQDAYVVRTDSEGNIIWDITFGGSETDRFYDGVETIDNNLIFDEKTYDSSYDDKGVGIVTTSFNEFIIYGHRFHGSPTYEQDTWLIKFSFIEDRSIWHVATTGSDSTGTGSEGNPFATIQAGIDAASDGDTVLVTSGTYLEQVTITNSLTLAAYENVIIDGSGYDYVISISADTVTISGFEIVGDTLTVSGIIVRPGSDNVQLLSNVIHGMKLPNQNSDILASYGILAYGLEDIVPDPPSNLIIDNNEIYDINAFGISLGTFTDSVYIKNNYIHDLELIDLSGYGYNDSLSIGIIAFLGNWIEIEDNIFSNVVVGSNLLLSQGSVGSNQYQNQVGIYLAYDGNNPIEGVELLPSNALAEFTGTFNETTLMIKGYFVFIQNALDFADPFTEIFATPGVFTENIIWPATSGIQLIGSGQDTTIIDGNQAGSVVTFENEEDTTTVLTGFTIQNGSAADGGGIYCTNNSSPKLTNVIIISNTADYGGGIYCNNNSNPTFTNVTISGNTAEEGGGIGCDGSSPSLVNCILWNNHPEEVWGSPNISHSDIQGGWEGEGNIDTDPLFCEPDSGDYTLAENSPCVGTGQDGANMGAFGVGCEAILLTDKDVIPLQYLLHQNYPNPFNPVTTLRYDLPEDALVNITIYNIMGQEVRNLVSDQQNAGFKAVQWNATNDAGSPVSAGLYLYTIQAGDPSTNSGHGFRQTRKMLLLK